MKQLFAILLLSAMVLSSCGDVSRQGGEESSVDVVSVETTASIEEMQIRSVDDMTEIDGVLSVTKITEYCTADESAYKINFEIDGLKRYAEIALPNDYDKKVYPSVLYFPDIGYEVKYLIDNFAKKDVIAIRLFSRGSKGNEGTRDFCGEDFSDAKKLLAICNSCGFLSNGGIFTAGAATGSTPALKLAAEYPESISGCAVVDAIWDYEAFAEERGEDVKSMFLTYIGCGEDELSAELEKRSPKSFYKGITAPVMMFCYEESPFVSKNQSDMLKELLDGNGCDTEIQYLAPASSDFNGTAFMKLIPWIKNISKNLK